MASRKGGKREAPETRVGAKAGAKGPPSSAELIPKGVPALIFLIATVVLFGEFIFSREMLVGHDTLSLGYMARAFFAERVAAGDFPFWSPRLLGGIPSIEALAAGDSLYPTSLLYLLMAPYRALGWKLVLHVFAGGFFMFGWIRSLGLHRGAATLAGLAWVMAPVIVTLVLPGNDGKLMVGSLAPLVFWATEALLRAPGPGRVAGLAGAVALTSLTTQFQTSYFLFLTVGAYALFRLVTDARTAEGGGARSAAGVGALFLGASLLGGAVAAVQIVPAADYVTEASRRTSTTVGATPEQARAYSSSWSFHPEEALGLAIPEFVGGNGGGDSDWVRNTYWGRNGFKGNHEYVGIIILAMAAMALAGSGPRRGTRRFLAGAGIVWLLFALGAHTPVWRVFYEVVPGISLFRVPSLSAFLVSFSATTLFAFTVHDLLSSKPDSAFLASTRGRVLLGGLGLLVLGLLLQASGTLPRLWTAVFFSDIGAGQRAVLSAAAPFITRGFLLALVLAGAAVGAVWAHQTGKLGPTALLAVLGGLVAVDLGRVDRPFIQTLDYFAWSAPDANVRFLQGRLDQEGPFRVVDFRNAQNVDLAMHGLDLVAGHHPNDLARYRTLLGLEGSQSSGRNLTHPVVLRILNAKYLLWPETVQGGPPAQGMQPLSRIQGPDGIEAVYPYPGLDRAWFAASHRVLDDEAALRRILEEPFNPADEVILAEEPDMTPASARVQASVSWLSMEPDERRIRVENDGPGYLVVSENWYPGWEATLDGSPVDLLRANLTLGAVAIPRAGTHEVVLRYEAPTVKRWGMVSLVALLAVAGLWLVPLLAGRGRSRD